MKKAKYVISEEIKTKYYNAIAQQCYFYNSNPIKTFKQDHPEEFYFLHGFHAKKKEIEYDLNIMKEIDPSNVIWGTLTFNNEKNKNQEIWKRKEVQSFLNEMFYLWLMVEEHGTRNTERYHVHFIGCLRYSKTLEQVKEHWHSFTKLKPLESVSKCAKYLADYSCKALPKIRRNKVLIATRKHFKKGDMWKRLGFSSPDHISLAEKEYNEGTMTALSECIGI